MPKGAIRLVVDYKICGAVNLSTIHWAITDTLSNEQFLVPKKIWVTPFQLKKIEAIISRGQYVVDPLMIHSHEFNYLRQEQEIENIA